MSLTTQITLLACASALAWTATAADSTGSASQASSTSSPSSAAPPGVTKAETPPPLPLHQIEGNGGVFSTFSAYLVNPPRNGEPVGRSSVGFGYDLLNLGDLPTAIAAATAGAVNIDDDLAMHNANAQLQILQEGDFGTVANHEANGVWGVTTKWEF